MRGVITLRDVLGNLRLVLREFGAGCVLRCLVASVRRRPTTFLEVVFAGRAVAALAAAPALSSAAASPAAFRKGSR